MKKLKDINNPELFFDCGQPQRIYTEITLLDLFAGMAMQGMLANDSDRIDEPMAKEAYETAQGMLEEREKILKGEAA